MSVRSETSMAIDAASKLLFAARFTESFEQFNAIMANNPSIKPYLWQRGLCGFFCQKYHEAAEQFEVDMQVNHVDVEETVWKFMCQRYVLGFKEAQAEIVPPSEGDVRIPMKEILEVFMGKKKVKHVLDRIKTEEQLFYGYYYIGLYYQVLGNWQFAYDFIKKATSILRPAGDDYMGKLAKMHLNLFNPEQIGNPFSLPAPLVARTYLIGERTYSFSKVIRGCWQLSKGHLILTDGNNQNSNNYLIQDFEDFVLSGITTLDCGDIYSGVEEAIGNSIIQYRLSQGEGDHVPDIQIHTKFVPDLDQLAVLGMDYCEAVLIRSLSRLGHPIDLLQFHWWDFSIDRYAEVAGYLNELRVNKKLFKHLAVTNFDQFHLAKIVDSGFKIYSNQIQYSLLDRRCEKGLTEYCKKNDIIIIAYGAIAGGFISNYWLGKEDPKDNLTNRSLVKYHLIIEEFGGWDKFQELLKILNEIGKKHSVSISIIATQWVLQQPQVGGLIVGGRNSKYLEETLINLNSNTQSKFKKNSFSLDSEDLQKIENFFKNGRLDNQIKGDVYELERDAQSKHAQIMKYNLNLVGTLQHLEELERRTNRFCEYVKNKDIRTDKVITFEAYRHRLHLFQQEVDYILKNFKGNKLDEETQKKAY